jgi:hypothetical protein
VSKKEETKTMQGFIPARSRFADLMRVLAAAPRARDRSTARPAAAMPSPRARPSARKRAAQQGARDVDVAVVRAFARHPDRSPFAHLAGIQLGPAVPPASTDDAGRTARAIVAAADLARAGGRERPKPTGLAAEILAAGAHRRELGRTR